MIQLECIRVCMIISYCSLTISRLTFNTFMLLASAFLHLKSLQELKWVLTMCMYACARNDKMASYAMDSSCSVSRTAVKTLWIRSTLHWGRNHFHEWVLKPFLRYICWQKQASKHILSSLLQFFPELVWGIYLWYHFFQLPGTWLLHCSLIRPTCRSVDIYTQAFLAILSLFGLWSALSTLHHCCRFCLSSAFAAFPFLKNSHYLNFFHCLIALCF